MSGSLLQDQTKPSGAKACPVRPNMSSFVCYSNPPGSADHRQSFKASARCLFRRPQAKHLFEDCVVVVGHRLLPWLKVFADLCVSDFGFKSLPRRLRRGRRGHGQTIPAHHRLLKPFRFRTRAFRFAIRARSARAIRSFRSSAFCAMPPFFAGVAGICGCSFGHSSINVSGTFSLTFLTY